MMQVAPQRYVNGYPHMDQACWRLAPHLKQV